jgi:hypothetical protein
MRSRALSLVELVEQRSPLAVLLQVRPELHNPMHLLGLPDTHRNYRQLWLSSAIAHQNLLTELAA